MAKNKNTPANDSEKSKDYYKLNTNAVDRLVNADKIEIPQDKRLRDPAKQYRSQFLDKIPDVIKALFLKAWFAGAVCFFILFGISFIDFLDQIVVLSIVMGMITDLLTNNAIRLIETVSGGSEKWIMFPKGKYWTFFANIFYSALILFCVTQVYELLKFNVEPLLFGIIYMLFDLLFVSMRNLMKTIINDAINKVNKQ